MINVSFKSKKRECFAEGIFDEKENTILVKKGAKISIRTDEKFRMSKEARKREDKALFEKNILKKDLKFKSPSIAAQFISGSSLNGLKVWKTEDKRPLKEYLERKN